MMTDGQSRHITSKWCDIAQPSHQSFKYLHLWNFQPLGVSSRGKVVFWYAVIVFLGFGSRTNPHFCLGRNVHMLKSPRATFHLTWYGSLFIGIVGYHTKWPKKVKFLSQSGLETKLTTVSSTLQVWHMANYQVPTEGACSLNPVNTVYFTVQYTLALSWITP